MFCLLWLLASGFLLYFSRQKQSLLNLINRLALVLLVEEITQRLSSDGQAFF